MLRSLNPATFSVVPIYVFSVLDWNYLAMEANAGKSFQVQIIFFYSPAFASIASYVQSNAENTSMVYCSAVVKLSLQL